MSGLVELDLDLAGLGDAGLGGGREGSAALDARELAGRRLVDQRPVHLERLALADAPLRDHDRALAPADGPGEERVARCGVSCENLPQKLGQLKRSVSEVVEVDASEEQWEWRSWSKVLPQSQRPAPQSPSGLSASSSQPLIVLPSALSSGSRSEHDVVVRRPALHVASDLGVVRGVRVLEARPEGLALGRLDRVVLPVLLRADDEGD